LKDCLVSGQVAGAALDVFETEPPAADHPLFGAPNFICTPHLGASTNEAQVNVALQVAEQLADYLVNGGITNALNVPSLSAEEAPKLKPYMALAEKLGSLVGQLAHGNLTRISIEREGAAAGLNGKPITAAVLAGFMRRYSDSVNMVNAPFLAKERGLDVSEIRHEREGAFNTLIRVTVETAAGPRSVAGTLFGNDAPRLVEIFGIGIEAELAGHMLYIVNDDKPGFIGRIGTLLGARGINIGLSTRLYFSDETAANAADPVLALIEQALGESGIDYVKLTGETTDRATPVRRFQAGEVPVFLISLKAGGTGLNLTAADTVILYDPWWNPAAEAQAIDRAHRIGQDKPVFAYRLIALGTVEEKMQELQARKRALADALLAGSASTVAQITEADLEALFAPLE
jgi:hypothetical protein